MTEGTGQGTGVLDHMIDNTENTKVMCKEYMYIEVKRAYAVDL